MNLWRELKQGFQDVGRSFRLWETALHLVEGQRDDAQRLVRVAKREMAEMQVQLEVQMEQNHNIQKRLENAIIELRQVRLIGQAIIDERDDLRRQVGELRQRVLRDGNENWGRL